MHVSYCQLSLLYDVYALRSCGHLSIYIPVDGMAQIPYVTAAPH